MNRRDTGRGDRGAWRAWVLGLLGILPALLLGAFGLHSLRREEDLALVDARRAAPDQAQRLAAWVARALLDPPLPTWSEVEAMSEHPDGAELRALGRASWPGPARLFSGKGSYPPGLEAAAVGETFLPRPIPPPWRGEWESAVIAERDVGRRSEAVTRWARLVTASEGAEWRRVVLFRLGRCLVQVGRTGEAQPWLEEVLRGDAVQVGETGLALDVLAARALLQAAAVDRRVAEGQRTWLNLLAERALIRRSIPESLLKDSEDLEPTLVAEWRRTAAWQESVRRAIPRLPTTLEARWLLDPGGTNVLQYVQPVADGTWVRWCPESVLSNRLVTLLTSHPLPVGLGAQVIVAGRPFARERPEPALPGEFLARASLPGFDDPGLEVRVSIGDLDVFHQPIRARARIFSVLVALASALCIFAVVTALRSYHRERGLAAQQSDFMASVSHELRAPLAAVRLMAEELMDSPSREAEGSGGYPRLILREAQRLGRLVENVLRHARIGQGDGGLDRRAVDLREVVRAPVESLQAMAADRGVRLEVEVPEVAVMAAADANALQQVVVNLVDNAVKHSPDGAVVRVGLSVGARDEVVPNRDPAVRPRPHGPVARLWVADQGQGIPESEHTRIFERFYRRGTELRRETAGVGLGLALSKRIVEAHAGSIVVSSQVGAGARFTVTLPLASTHESDPT